MITMIVRKSKMLGLNFFFFFFFFFFFLCGGERCEEGVGQWLKATRGVENS
jgi:predicted PurR-regulated permease PerM